MKKDMRLARTVQGTLTTHRLLFAQESISPNQRSFTIFIHRYHNDHARLVYAGRHGDCHQDGSSSLCQLTSKDLAGEPITLISLRAVPQDSSRIFFKKKGTIIEEGNERRRSIG